MKLSILLVSVILLHSYATLGQEICNNAIDDDENGLIDLNDPTCDCGTTTPGTPVSLFPNSSFEHHSCCPSGYAQFSCTDHWMNASSATPDYFNTCSWVSPVVQSSQLFPFPDGEGATNILATRFYKEYIGSCLSSSLIAGTSYTLRIQAGIYGSTHGSGQFCDISSLSSFPLALYGTSSCTNLPFSGNNCPPASEFYVLALETIPTDGLYHTITFTFTPDIPIEGLVLGPACPLPNDYPGMQDDCKPAVVLDNLILNETTAFSLIDTSGRLCQNNLVLSASSATVPGGTFQWYTNGIAMTGQTNATLPVSELGLAEGNYQLVYTSNGECSESTIKINPNYSPIVTTNDTVICQGESVLLTANGAMTYSWSPTNSLSASSGTSINAKPDSTTTYTVIGTTNGCSDTTTANVTVHALSIHGSYSQPELSPDQFTTTFSAFPAGYEYNWMLEDGSVYSGDELIHTFARINGDYEILLIGGDDFGCFDTTTLVIHMDAPIVYYIPNAFTPNGDEANNTFQPVILNRLNNEDMVFSIFNRLGELIFESRNAAIGWDGTYLGKPAPEGAYTWKIRFENSENDGINEMQGHLTLIR